MVFSAEDVGAYMRLLCYQWGNGAIPSRKELVDRIAGCMVGPDVMAKFPDGKNARLEREREKQADYRMQQSAKGKASAQARFNRGSTVVQPSGEPEGQPKVNSPSPSPSPIKKEAWSPSAIEIPEALYTAGFLNAWDRWCAHRRELKKPLTKTSTAQQLKDLAEMGESRAIATLHHSVKNGWQGIFEPAGSRSATASEVPSGPRSWRNTPSSEWTPEDHAAYEKA